MSPEAPRPEQQDAEQQDQIGVRFEMQERVIQVGELLEQLPDAPEKKMLQHVLEAAQRIIFPLAGDRNTPWLHKSRSLRVELESALSELRRLVDDGV